MAKRNHFKRISRKKYQKKRHKNPFFQKKRQLPWKPILLVILTLSIAIGGGIWMLTSERFSIQSVDVTGLEHISHDALETAVLSYIDDRTWLFFDRSNLFLFDKENLKGHLNEIFTFADAEISVSNQTLFLTIEERTSNLIWKTGERSYVIDLTGVVVRAYNGEEGLDNLPVFFDKNALEVEVGGTVMTQKEIEGTFLFHEHLNAQGIVFYDTTFDRLAGKWVSINTESGYDILFDPSGDIDNQAARLATVLSQVSDASELQYIDLRFGDHVYYK